ncbi:hypothetical protein [Curtobacterium sp. MCBD17_021]|uniref:hypothetical protein n=1 Tax=Curtobacterium sp. MCBD17_021 TaxID=2175665 RepID=UPI0011B6BE97|nr:hypothetical protein [Curtobacterium sp. MCBD17_021]
MNTDALRRDARVLAPGFPDVAKRLNAAADELDQLRSDLHAKDVVIQSYAVGAGSIGTQPAKVQIRPDVRVRVDTPMWGA